MADALQPTNISDRAGELASINEMFDIMLVNERNRASDSMELLSRLDAIERRLEAMESSLSLLVSAVAISPALRANVVVDKNMSQYTRTVMTSVPAILLILLWRHKVSDLPFPTTSSYLEKLFRAIGDSYDTKLRSELGTVFSQVIDKGPSITLGAICSLLSDSASVNSSTMRSHIMKLFNLVSSHFAFMIPETLCKFIHKISGITSGGDIEYTESPITRFSAPISPGYAYDVMGPDWLGSSKVMKYIAENKDRTSSSKFLKGLCTSLKNGIVPTTEESRNLGFIQDGSIDELFESPKFERKDRLSSAPNSAQSQSRFHKYGAKAADLFK